MQTFREWLNEKEGKETYKDFFNKKLEKYGVKSATELSGEDKKKFFDEVDAEWEGENEEPEAGDVNEAVIKITVPENELKKIFRGFIKLSGSSVLILEGADLSELEKFKKSQKCNDVIVAGSEDKNQILIMIK